MRSRRMVLLAPLGLSTAMAALWVAPVKADEDIAGQIKNGTFG